MRGLLALILLLLAGTAGAADRLPGVQPWIWSQDIGAWGTAANGGRVEVFASAVDLSRKVGAVGVIWYREQASGAEIAQVRYPALLCGAAFFEDLRVTGSRQISADEIDLVLSMTRPVDAPAAIGGGGEISVRVLNGARSVDGIRCPE